ncbi:MAG TPA: hypothetical protein VLF59_03560 [Candidatus Saccharimonadales bacterium]|nr:hypothetical protein [Candidatus Saccharimonadales bacterium]
MSGVREYAVVQPPTSGEVFSRVTDMIAERTGVLALTLLEERDVPRPTPQEVDMSVRRLTFSSHGHTVEGTAAQIASIVIRLNAEDDQPATASIVFDEEQLNV